MRMALPILFSALASNSGGGGNGALENGAACTDDADCAGGDLRSLAS